MYLVRQGWNDLDRHGDYLKQFSQPISDLCDFVCLLVSLFYFCCLFCFCFLFCFVFCFFKWDLRISPNKYLYIRQYQRMVKRYRILLGVKNVSIVKYLLLLTFKWDLNQTCEYNYDFSDVLNLDKKILYDKIHPNIPLLLILCLSVEC